YRVPCRIRDNTQIERWFVLPIGNTETAADIHELQFTDFAGERSHPTNEFSVVVELVGIDARPGVSVETDDVEVVAGFGDDGSRAIVGNAELGVRARSDLFVVARADTGVDTYTEATVVSPLGKAR